jgi:lipoyl(octanoyl) transferase
MSKSLLRELNYYNLGLVDYSRAWNLQKILFELRSKNEVNDTLLFVEHPNTYTLGKTADKKNLIGSETYQKENNITVYEIDRGGDITYHGPGQVVGYPIINLKDWYEDTHKYLRGLEEIIMLTCSDYGVFTERKEGLTGVWIENRKIAAIGIKVSRWITMHGFAFNINTDLSLFNGIIPCGISDKKVTSLENELGMHIDMEKIKESLLKHFINLFKYEKVNDLTGKYLLTFEKNEI